MSIKKALVTGGMGFVGGHLVKRLLSQGVEVTVLDKSIYKAIPFDPTLVKLVEVDILSKEYLEECLQDVDVCFHLAAISSSTKCQNDWLFSLQNNVVAFNHLLDLLMKQDSTIKFIYASTASVYCNSTEVPQKESDRVSPCKVIAADKLTNEIYAAVAGRSFGLSSIGLRLFNVYGTCQYDSNHYSGVISRFKKSVLQQQPLIIYGTGEQTRDFVHVDDVVNAFILAANVELKGAQVINVCSGQSLSINELATRLQEVARTHLPVIHKEARPGDQMHSRGDTHLAKELLNFTAKTKIESGLQEFFNPEKPSYYVEKRH